MITYAELGPHLYLKEIVFAGSHDAGITEGKANTRTQSLNIYDQAVAGVRLFDLRINAASVGWNKSELKAYHAGMGIIKSDVSTKMRATGQKEDIVRSTLPVGAFGMGLKDMLTQAHDFVDHNPGEFLILKFDKSTNWTLIYAYCVQFLKGKMYTGRTDLNLATLGELAGSVIVLFHSDGVNEVRLANPQAYILGFVNYYSKAGGSVDFDFAFAGLQYFGKGGTSVDPRKMEWSKSGKIAENEATQRGIMRRMATDTGGQVNFQVLGMMYWTSTGITESIKARNKKMWTTDGKISLTSLWKGGLRDSIDARLASNVNPASYASSGLLRTFMPNIIMIDFAKEEYCKVIRSLNTTAQHWLTQRYIEDDTFA
jgi:hypothetical protein